jgi:hypothetical protein
MKIDVESTKGGFLWILETDEGVLIAGNSREWKEIWDSCRKLNRPTVDQGLPKLVRVS